MQGADLTKMTDKTAPRVTITHHPDVRRSLMLQKAYAEGLRAVYIYTSTFQDRVRLGDEGSGISTELAEKVNDLLLPIVKGVGSERATEQLVQSLQTLGGSGFLQDYPIEQYIRDAKIDSSTRAPPRSSPRTSCSARSSGTTARRSRTSRARSRRSSTPRRATAGSRRSASSCAPRSPTCRGCSAR